MPFWGVCWASPFLPSQKVQRFLRWWWCRLIMFGVVHKEEHSDCSRSCSNTEERGQRRNTVISSVHSALLYLLNAAYKPWMNWHSCTTSWNAAIYWHKSSPAQRSMWLLKAYYDHIIFLHSSPLNQTHTVVSTAVTFLVGTCFGMGSFVETTTQPSGPKVTMAVLQPLSSSASPTCPASSGFRTEIPVRISAWRKALNIELKQTFL